MVSGVLSKERKELYSRLKEKIKSLEELMKGELRVNQEKDMILFANLLRHRGNKAGRELCLFLLILWLGLNLLINRTIVLFPGREKLRFRK